MAKTTLNATNRPINYYINFRWPLILNNTKQGGHTVEHSANFSFAIFFLHFTNLRIENPHQLPQDCNFSEVIFKCGKFTYCSKILDEFDYGGSASLNLCIMDHLMSRLRLTLLLVQGKAIKFCTNVEFNIFDISSGFYEECKSVFFAEIFMRFPRHPAVSLA